jgi:hypothetical protein
MARKKKRSRRRKTFSILNGLEALAYSQILSVGITGGGIWDFVTGETNLGQSSVYDSGLGVSSMVLHGEGQISLGDFMTQPTLAIDTMTSNFTANIVPMAVAGFGTSVAFRIGRRLLRKPLSMVTRDLIKPVFGAGVRM